MTRRDSGRAWIRRLATWLRWPVALAILGYLVYAHLYTHADRLQDVLDRGIRWWAVAAAAICFSITLLLTFLRWYLLVWAQELRFGYHDTVRAGLIGFLFNFVGPGSAGGDLLKAALIAKSQQGRRFVAVSTVVVDRMLGLIGLFLVGLAAYAVQSPSLRTGVIEKLAGFFALGALGGLSVIGFALVPHMTRLPWIVKLTRVKYVGHVFGEALNALIVYQSRWPVIVAGLGVSVLGHVAILFAFFFCSQSLPLGSAVPEFENQLVLGAGANVGAALIPVPGGVGAFEGGLAYLYRAADRLTLEERFGDRDWPPDWRSSFLSLASDEVAAAGVAEGVDGVATDELQTHLVRLAEDGRPVGPAIFREGAGPLPPGTLWNAYAEGHHLLAFQAGLLTGLVFRTLTVLVAVLGGVYYLVSRREVDAAIETSEHEDSAGNSSTTPTADSEPGRRTGSGEFRAAER